MRALERCGWIAKRRGDTAPDWAASRYITDLGHKVVTEFQNGTSFMHVHNVIMSESVQQSTEFKPECCKQRHKGIPMDKRSQVVQLHNDGLTNREIVKASGVSLGSVSNILRAAVGSGLPVAPMRRKKAEGDNPSRSTKRGKPVVPEETPKTIGKRYKLPAAIADVIKELAPLYGSQGRAIQLATEFLVRLHKPLKVEMPEGKGGALMGYTYKLTPRTAQLIDQMVEQYGTRGAVLSACAAILDRKVRIIVENE